MNDFTINIIQKYGDAGKKWLENLPNIIKLHANNFNLTKLKPYTHLTHNYVLSGFMENKPIALKLGFDNKEEFQNEIAALEAFKDYGAVKIYKSGIDFIILSRPIPGTSLKTYFPLKEKESLEIASRVIQRLHKAHIPEHNINFLHIEDILTSLDNNHNIPINFLNKARNLRNNLLLTMNNAQLIHGDFHHGNILNNDLEWLIIDSKAFIGEGHYDIATFIRNPIKELAISKDSIDIIKNRISFFSKNLEMSKQRIKDWCFLQSVLSWIWALEDKSDTIYFKKLTEIFYIL